MGERRVQGGAGLRAPAIRVARERRPEDLAGDRVAAVVNAGSRQSARAGRVPADTGVETLEHCRDVARVRAPLGAPVAAPFSPDSYPARAALPASATALATAGATSRLKTLGMT